MPFVYMASETTLHPLRPKLRCVDGNKLVYDPKSCADIADDWLGHGTKYGAFDFEPTQWGGLSTENVLTARRIWQAFRTRGVTLDFWGAGDVGQTDPVNKVFVSMSRMLHPVWYNYTRNVGAWVVARKDQALRLRKNFRSRELCPWVCPFSTGWGGTDPDGTPLPLDEFRTYMTTAADCGDHVCVWANLAEATPGGGVKVLPWSAAGEWVGVMADVAKRAA